MLVVEEPRPARRPRPARTPLARITPHTPAAVRAVGRVLDVPDPHGPRPVTFDSAL